jgi:cyanophycin synthetase
MQGKVKFMIANVLAASLAAYTWGFDSAVIGNALTNFTPDYEHAPGRLNIFKFNNFNILVDYAHNPHGFSAVEDYLQHVEAPRKIGIISGVGDRRDEDIRECGYIAGRMFDHIIIRKKKDMRGRVQENVTGLLLDGINAAGRNVTHDYVDNELDAVRHAMAIAKPGEYIISLTDDIPEVVEMIKEYQQKELAETDA